MEKVGRAISYDAEEIEGRGELVSYSFKQFSQTLFRNDICSDVRTIRNKWDVLVAKGILIEVRGKHYELALFDISRFNDEFHTALNPEIQHTHTHTHTNAKIVEGEIE